MKRLISYFSNGQSRTDKLYDGFLLRFHKDGKVEKFTGPIPRKLEVKDES
jgi:hypothetical protein